MDKKIAIAGTGYVGLSVATLLAQHNHVTAVDVIPEKVDLINSRKSPIRDEYIEKYLAEKRAGSHRHSTERLLTPTRNMWWWRHLPTTTR